jgi:hypothetical protein
MIFYFFQDITFPNWSEEKGEEVAPKVNFFMQSYKTISEKKPTEIIIIIMVRHTITSQSGLIE